MTKAKKTADELRKWGQSLTLQQRKDYNEQILKKLKEKFIPKSTNRVIRSILNGLKGKQSKK